MNAISFLSPKLLSRFSALFQLIAEHGGRAILEQAGLGDAVLKMLPGERKGMSTQERADSLARQLEKMGPTYVKIGQMLASQADLLPREYTNALSRLQDDVDPMDFDVVRRLIEEALGGRLEDLYMAVLEKPLGSASIAQVHQGMLHDGTPVAIKVQRPGIRQQMHDDLDALESLATLIDRHSELGRQYNFSRILRQLRHSLDLELDYETEAANMVTLRQAMSKFKRLAIPKPFEELTCSRVLTMEFFEGKSVDKSADVFEQLGESACRHLLDELFHAYLHQVMVSGTFHADPHPGNVMLRKDGRLGLIDFGNCGFVEPKFRQGLLRLLIAISESRMVEASELAIELGYRTQSFNAPAFREALSEALAAHHRSEMASMETGRMVAAVCRCASMHGLDIPEAVTMLGKMLLHLDHVVEEMHVDFDSNKAIRHHAPGIAAQQTLADFTLANLLSNSLTMKTMISEMPMRVNRVLDVLADNAVRLNVDAVDEDRLINGLKNIANRVAVGVVIGALVLTGAILTAGESNWKGNTAFVLAGVMGVVFFGRMLWADVRDNMAKNRRRRNQ